MSVDLTVYLKRDRVPSPQEWQAAITRAGFPLVLDQEFDPLTSGGFRPCHYDGVPTGFEYYAGDLNADTEPGVDARGYDFSVTLAIRTQPKEMQASAAAAASLCALADGLILDPQSGMTFEAEAALDWARSMIEMCEQHGL